MPDSRKKTKAKKGRGKELSPSPVVPADVENASTVASLAEGQRADPPAARELRAALWSGENPFSFADPSQVDLGGTNPNLAPELVDAILSETAPTFWLELGTRLGGAALATADRIAASGLGTAICCVDSFTGGVDDWLAENEARERHKWRYLNLSAGRPTAYERFLANVQQAGYGEMIVPLPCTPLVAMRLIQMLVEQERLSRRPEVIFLGAAHEPEETLLELQRAWELLSPGGVLFGDHWSLPALRHDVRAFARTVEADTTRMVAFLRRFEESYLDGNVFLYRGQWVLFKPVAES